MSTPRDEPELKGRPHPEKPLYRLEQTFVRLAESGRAALMPYFCLGYPDLRRSLDCVRAAVRAGADIVELGIPFSDPVADGPSIQYASTCALAQGTTLRRALEELIAAPLEVPAVLMSYLNPIVQMGETAFAAACVRAGVSAVIVPDLPFGETYGPIGLDVVLASAGLCRIQMVAPTTPDDRLAAIGKAAQGFVYLVSTTGTTGVRNELPADLAALVARVRRHTRRPLCVGFGVATAAHAARVAQIADGVIVGSALVERIRESLAVGVGWSLEQGRSGRLRAGEPDVGRAVGLFVEELAQALRNPSQETR